MKAPRLTLPKHWLTVLLGFGLAASQGHAAQIGVFTDADLTEFDPVLGVRVLKASQTWTADNQYILTDRVFIKNGQTLTIQPGTKIYGSVNENGSGKTDDSVGALIACRGGRLVADGTAANPIIFTSIRELEVETGVDSPFDPDSTVGPAPTAADGGQWGGVILLGNAPITVSDNLGANLGQAEIEGFLPAGSPSNDGDSRADAIEYGPDGNFPPDPTDDSGIIRYVSIRHGGYEFETGKEINGLTLGGVGSGTIIEHVEVYANSDDGVEFFGGTVNTKYLVMAYNQDDSFDIDMGHTGTHQFWFSVQAPGIADGGGEWDGIESNPSNGTNQAAGKNAGLQLSKPIIYNATFIGAGAAATPTVEKGNHGFTIEDYFNGELYNSVIDDFSGDLVNLRDGANSTGATPAMAHNTVGRFGGGTPGSNQTYITGVNSFNLFYNALGQVQNGNSAANTNPQYKTYTRNGSNVLTAIDPRPAGASPLLASNGATLQTGAPVATNYRGAFSASSNWAAGWTKLSKSGVLTSDLNLGANDVNVVGDTSVTTFDATLGVQVLTGTNQVWTADKTYILTDRVFIKNGQTLTIQPGTKIYGLTRENGAGKTDDSVGALIACRGGRLVADGTAANPIIFSSVKELESIRGTDVDGDTVVASAPTAADGGQWGGVILLGNAPITVSDNLGGNLGQAEIEGFLPAGSPSNDGDSRADAIEYGPDGNFPPDPADDSGIIRYVSIRHGGYEFETGKEINGLTLGGVGSGTIIEHVEVYANSDDGVEFFGGTVNTKYLVMAYNQDDSFDIDMGHTGTHQFWFSVQAPGIADGGGEWDGIESNPSNGTNQAAGKNAGLQLSKPIIYNATFIGAGATATPTVEKGNHGFTIEDYFNGELYNSVIDDFAGDLVNLRDGANSTGATPAMAHNTVGRFGGGTPGSNQTYITGVNSFNLFYNALGQVQNGNSAANTNPQYTTYTRSGSNVLTAIDPRPAAASPLLVSNGATLQTGAPTATTYRGAFGADNWASGWTKLSTSGVLVGGGSTPSDFDTWGAANGVSAGNLTGDVDGDGVTNEFEYAFGLNPQSGASSNAFLAQVNKATGKFSYTRRAVSLTGLEYNILTSSTLAGWTEDAGATQVVTGTVGDIETVEVTLSPALLAEGKLFIRVEFE
ncbi:hypothetical protein OJ996_01355 [Luteolibacter sp. GHJ8]|uniref:T9SS C-terminal target domain-containing protein n=1 Tax=Luteolibacter rhizosphaerae TaxID=2989719 RepID=A0ABT3FX94_9BACT|nr:hypothetical protein [Luteolibacter rhizosphaerae]MCW1912199.1 hypothetical protein [Luteolibacter rhizosphaerae]